MTKIELAGYIVNLIKVQSLIVSVFGFESERHELTKKELTRQINNFCDRLKNHAD